MLFMVIERFKDRDPIPVYKRLRDQGIKFPEPFEPRRALYRHIGTGGLHCPDLADAAKHHSAWRRRAFGGLFWTRDGHDLAYPK